MLMKRVSWFRFENKNYFWQSFIKHQFLASSKLLRDFLWWWWWWRNCQKEFCSEEFVMWKFSPFYASKGLKSIFESSKTQALLQVRKAFNALTPATQTHNESQFFLKKCSFRAKWMQCFISWTKYGVVDLKERFFFQKNESLA